MENTAVAIQEEMRRVPLSLIVPGNNPRKFFDPQKMGELVKSIRERGILQPVRLRPIGNKFEIVAGERRVRAALAVYGQEGDIPAIVKALTDQEAEEAALIENTIRDDMSVTEEARAAEKVLAHCKGDRDEAARVLAWPMQKLARRLALLELTEEVMTALDERKITTGHAELLAAVLKEKQNSTLGKIIEHSLTVQFCRDNLLRKATKFEGAIFEIAGCAACRFNSEIQASLFVENIGLGCCTNHECFEKKTLDKLEELKVELAEDFPAVRIVEAGDHESFSSLEAEGNLGVGNEQYAACKSCGDFGATISSLPATMGQVTKSVCFNLSCHQKKVAEHIKAEKSENATNPDKTGKTEGTGSRAKSASEGKTNKASASEVSQKVKEYRRKIWNGIAKRGFVVHPDKANFFVFSLGVTGDLHHVDRTKLKEFYEKIAQSPYPGSHAEGLEALSRIPAEKQSMLASAIAVASIEKLSEAQIVNALRFLNLDLATFWKISSDYLNLLTKSEIESVVIEIGLDKVMGDNFKKTLNGKKDELIKTILNVDSFQWQGAIPKMMRWS